MTITAGWPRSWASAKPSLPSSGPSSSASGRPRSPRRKPPVRLRERAGAEARRAGAQAGRDDRQARSRAQGVRGDDARQENGHWEQENAGSIINRWQVLEPKALSATNGAILTKEPDGSIVASGPDGKGVVTLVAETELSGITGFRLEVLTDSRLPKKGPGRGEDGNFVAHRDRADRGPHGRPETGQGRQARQGPG